MKNYNMSFAVLILVSSLTYSVVYLLPESNALEEANIKTYRLLLLSTLPFFVSWMFEQKWFAITERIKAKPIKKDFNVFIDKIRGRIHER
jgi:hypothetical protein